jgi:sulfate transport system ATP-binding protein
MVERVTYLGWEVRIELVLGDGSPVQAQLPRDEAEQLELVRGDVVWLKGGRSHAYEPLTQ